MVALVIIPEALKARAEAAVSQLSPLSVGESFSVPLGAIAEGPVTHWGCLPIVNEETYQRIHQLLIHIASEGGWSLVACDDTEIEAAFSRERMAAGLVQVVV